MILSAQNFNTDESKVPDFDLPNLLLSENGTKINNIMAWETIRRPELVITFEEQVYGKAPLDEILVEISENILDTNAFGGKATIREVSFRFKNNEKYTEAILLLVLPKIQQASPVFLGYNFSGNHTILPNTSIKLPKGWVMPGDQIGVTENQASALSRGVKYSRWPVLNILARGYGLATMHYGDIDPDFDDGFKNGVHKLFSNSEHLKKDDWGAIATWSWGLSKIMDYLETNDAVDHKKVALMGHSRLGKTALWAGAKDPRFALVISNNSGCGGAALSKRRFGETVAAINKSFPHWFCGNYKSYNDNEAIMPFDQHQLLALMAPRPLYVASAKNDSWADPKGEFLALKHSSQAYQLYDENGLITGGQPKENKPLQAGKLGYHMRRGNHDVTPYDWEQFMNFADIHFNGTK